MFNACDLHPPSGYMASAPPPRVEAGAVYNFDCCNGIPRNAPQVNFAAFVASQGIAFLAPSTSAALLGAVVTG